AEMTLKPLTDREKPNTEALRAIINIYYWWQKYEDCIEYCNALLSIEAYNEDVLLIKANCLERLGRDEDAILVLNSSLYDSNNPGIAALRTIIGKKAKNAIAVSYLNIS